MEVGNGVHAPPIDFVCINIVPPRVNMMSYCRFEKLNETELEQNVHFSTSLYTISITHGLCPAIGIKTNKQIEQVNSTVAFLFYF